MKPLTLLTLVFFVAIQSQAQVVETMLSFPTITDGMDVDAEGNLYTTSGGLAGNTVGQFNLELDVFVPGYINGLYGPTDVDFLNDSILIITNYDIGIMSSYNFNTTELVTIAEGLDGPAGIATNEEGEIYVTNWGGPPTYNGHTITKISPSGESWVYIDSELLYRPQAITYNHEQTLIVHSNWKLYKIQESDSTLHFWTDLGAGVANMVFREKDSCIYGTSVGSHQILKIDILGNVEVFAGSSVGYEDGEVSDAKFTSPLGITFSPGEDTLYVSEGGDINRLRRIILTDFSGIDDMDIMNDGVSVYPNPLKKGNNLQIENLDGMVDYISLYSMDGRLIYNHFASVGLNELTVPASAFFNRPSGTYILVLVNDNGDKYHQHLVIE